MKIGLVVEGGGMKGAYSAAILDAFLEEGIHFDCCIGVSAGAANVASFVAGQKGRNIRFYTEHIHDPGYFGLKSFIKTGNLFGLEYIYGDLTNSDGKDPIDYKAIMESSMDHYAVATDAIRAKPVYFGKKDLVKDDYKVFMATSAIPAACKPVNIGNRLYYDGGIASSIPIQKALDEACDKVVVILSMPIDFVKTPEGHRHLYKKMCRKYPKIIEALDHRHITYMEEKNKVLQLEKENKVFIFAPSQKLNLGTFSMDEEKEQDLYDLGMQDFYQKKEELLKFIQ